MTNLQILSKQEIKAFNQPPVFSGTERKKYFRITVATQEIINQLRTPFSQLGFLLNLGYFKASGRFYGYHNWHPNDIQFAANQLSVSSDVIEHFGFYYKKELFHRHKKQILELVRKTPFSQQQQLFTNQLQLLISRHITPKKVFFAIIDWLLIQHIEVPSYNFLSSQVTKEMNRYEKKLHQLLKEKLTPSQITQLESLLIQQDDPAHTFKITGLKHVNQSEKPRKIARSVDTFKEIQQLFQNIEPFISILELSPDTWRAYSRWVMSAKGKQIKRISNIYKRYLHFIAFLYHQYSFRQDCFVRIFLNATTKVNNDFSTYEKDEIYQQKGIKEAYEGLLEEQVSYYKKHFAESSQIIETKNTTSEDKVEQMKNLIDQVKTNESAVGQQLKKLEKEQKKVSKDRLYYQWVKSQHAWLKNRVGGIIKVIELNKSTSDNSLIKAINNYQTLKGTAFCRSIIPLFDKKTQKYMLDDKNRPVAPLCKALFFLKVGDAFKAGKLNLKYSYRYRSIEEYLIPKARWEKEKKDLLQKAGLTQLEDFQKVIDKLATQLEKQVEKTNQRILAGKNEHVTIKKNGDVLVATPGVEKPDIEPVAQLFEPFKYTSIGDMLLDVHQQSKFMDHLTHQGTKYTKTRPDIGVFIAGIIAYGCNIGHYKMGQITKDINPSSLSNTTNWYFNKQNLDIANDQIVNLTKQLPIHELFQFHKDQQHTSSDGQKYNTAVESLNAARSFKYSGTDKGSTVYGFVDEAISTFYSLVITAAEREAPYVLDGLLHNEVYWEEDKQWLHHTDTHGQTEVMFAATNLLGISLAPRIKGIKKTKLYAFEKPKFYRDQGFSLAPAQSINQELIKTEWDTILRLLVTIRLKETTASSVFTRLSSYARQHPLFVAIKEMGRVYKSLYVLKYYDELKLRQLTEKQLNKVERSHQFALAVFFDNNQQIRLELKEDQDTAMACRVIIQNTIILWNCLRISEKLMKENKQAEKKNIIDILKAGSACTWQHVNFHGEYEFKQESMSNLKHLNLQEILDMKVV